MGLIIPHFCAAAVTFLCTPVPQWVGPGVNPRVFPSPPTCDSHRQALGGGDMLPAPRVFRKVFQSRGTPTEIRHRAQTEMRLLLQESCGEAQTEGAFSGAPGATLVVGGFLVGSALRGSLKSKIETSQTNGGILKRTSQI